MAVDRQRAEAGLDELVKLYREAQREIAAQVTEALRSGQINQKAYRTAAYQRIVNYLERVGVEADPIAKRLIEGAWREGDRSILRAVNPDMLGFTFDVINREAMEGVQRALTSSLFDARRTIGRQTFDVFRQASLRSTALGLLGTSGSRRTVSDNLRKRLERQGVKGFVDKAGKQWSLRSYTQMVARTTTREAVTAAQLLRMADQGIELARISSSGNPCPLCAEWQERLISLDGSRDTFNGESVWGLGDVPNGGPPFHPNCRHYWSPESVMFAPTRPKPEPPGSGSSKINLDVEAGVSRDGLKAVEHAREAIRQVHNPDMDLTVRQLTNRKNDTTRASYDPHDDAHVVRVKSETNALDAVHEIGHAVDHIVLGDGVSLTAGGRMGTIGNRVIRKWGSGVDGPDLKDWWKAIRASGIRESILNEPRLRHSPKHREYLTRPVELWARSYTQWVVLRSGDPVLKKLFEEMRSGSMDGFVKQWAWSDEDFLPIAEEIDRLMGWSK